MKAFSLYVDTDPPLFKVGRVVCSCALLAYGRFTQTGLHNLPAQGAAIVAANHPSDLDPALVGASFPRTLRFMAAEKEWDRRFVGRCIRRLGAFPVRRGSVDRDALRVALNLLARGEVVALFPEGDNYADGPRPFESGVGFLAAKSGAPVIPCAITGAQRVFNTGGLHWPRIELRVGEPVDVSGLDDLRNADLYQAITERVAVAVRALLEGTAQK